MPLLAILQWLGFSGLHCVESAIKALNATIKTADGGDEGGAGAGRQAKNDAFLVVVLHL